MLIADRLDWKVLESNPLMCFTSSMLGKSWSQFYSLAKALWISQLVRTWLSACLNMSWHVLTCLKQTVWIMCNATHDVGCGVRLFYFQIFPMEAAQSPKMSSDVVLGISVIIDGVCHAISRIHWWTITFPPKQKIVKMLDPLALCFAVTRASLTTQRPAINSVVFMWFWVKTCQNLPLVNLKIIGTHVHQFIPLKRGNWI
jgi:hypothetical protein